MKWIYLDQASTSGKVQYACSECGHVTTGPTKNHVCDETGVEMNQRREVDAIPESAFQE